MNYAHLIMIVLFQNTLVELGSCLAESEEHLVHILGIK